MTERPGIWVDLRAFYLVGQDAALAVLLCQVAFRQRKNTIEHDGEQWIPQSYRQWADQTGTTRQAVRSRIARLEALRLVATITVSGRRYMRLLLPMEQWPPLSELKQGVLPDTHQGVPQHTGGVGQHTKGVPQHTLITGTEKTDLGKAAEPLTFQPEDSEKKSSEPMANKVHGLGKGKSVAELAATIAEPDAPRALKCTTVTDLWHLWRETWVASNRGFCRGWTRAQQGQAKQLLKVIPQSKAGEVVAFVMGDWRAFTAEAERSEGAFKCPEQPTLGFLLRFVGVAVQMYDKRQAMPDIKPKMATLEPVAAPKPPKPKPAPDTQEGDKEGVAAVIAEFEKEYFGG